MRHHTRSFPVQVAGVVVVAVLTGAAGLAPLDLWDVGHASGERMDVSNPECPTMWDTIPLFASPEVQSLQQLKDPELPRGISRVPGTQSFRFTPPGGELPAAEPITNIPEFNDCQKFLKSDTEFESLYAIFASYKMDSIIGALGWHDVHWSSSNTQVATVDDSGMVLARAPGTTTIRASVTTQPSITATAAVIVETDSSRSTGATISVGTGRTVRPMGLGERRRAMAQFGRPTTRTKAAATIYSFGPGYPALGIGPNFSCLYVYFDASNRLRARVVPVPSPSAYGQACKNEFDPNVAIGTDLAVVLSEPMGTGASGNPYPHVARWDWDPATKRHSIDIGCGRAQCEIGAAPAGGAFDPPEPYDLPDATPDGDRRVIQVKGWHDEQFLAVPATPPSPDLPQSDRLKPSGLIGTVIPDPMLNRVTKAQLASPVKKWTTMAYVALREATPDPVAVAYYKKKLNFDLAPVQPLGPKLNRMQYCYGNRKHCEVPKASQGGVKCDNFFNEVIRRAQRVWVKVISANGDVRYFCITRRGHEFFKDTDDIPSTSRWRWILSDETVWTECVQGCCETEQ